MAAFSGYFGSSEAMQLETGLDEPRGRLRYRVYVLRSERRVEVKSKFYPFCFSNHYPLFKVATSSSIKPATDVLPSSERDHYSLTGWGHLIRGYGVLTVVSRSRSGEVGVGDKRGEQKKRLRGQRRGFRGRKQKINGEAKRRKEKIWARFFTNIVLLIYLILIPYYPLFKLAAPSMQQLEFLGVNRFARLPNCSKLTQPRACHN
jgi:hypothetical protein